MNQKTTHISTASIITPAIRTGDATGEHTIDLARMLTRMGASTEIICNVVYSALPVDIQPLVQVDELSKFVPLRDLTILQYPIWSPISERFRLASGTTLLWYHGVTPKNLWNSPEDFELLDKSERRTDLSWHADLVVCASPFISEEFRNHSAYPADRIRIVPLGVDTSYVGQKTDPVILDSLRSRWNLCGKQVLLYVGRIASNKRIDLLIEGLSLLANKYPNLVLLIVGDHDGTPASRVTFEQLSDQVQQLGLLEKVVFAGRVEDVAPFFHLADLFVHASQHEGFCVPLIEAMAAGVPIVASESGAMPWVLNALGDKSDAVGLTFTEGKSEELARQVERLLDDQDLRNTFIGRARNYVRNFDKQKFEKRMQDVIAEATILSSNKLVSPVVNLYAIADVAMRNYRVRSGIPIIGKLIESIRVNLTSHLKEAYVDRIIERQVAYNRSVIEEIGRLNTEIMRLRAEIKQLQQKSK